MKFAEAWWLFGTALALAVAAFYVVGGFRLIASIKLFGQPELVNKLLSARAGGRRALKGTLVVLSVAFAFVALAGPQYGRGTRMIPATNLDCVIVLDYSKSMYARDVSPNRSERAKAEVARLIADLPGARFGAVAFAGESVSFPLTSDGGAIAQFFRQNTPNDMPVGGTAIARALESARDLLARDPLSQKHQKVIVLVTDGEDLEGDPVQVATAASKDHVVIHVVQIGGRTAEAIPEVNEQGQVTGMRQDAEGRPLTTSLSASGEEQLTQIAKVTGGNVVRSEAGQTGIDEIAKRLKAMMTDELAERVETVYADIFYYPLALALLLLVIEVFIPVAKKASGAAVISLVLLAFGCEDLNNRLFMRYSPDVDQAIEALGAQKAEDSAALLTTYLSTGQCKAGEIGTPDQVRKLPRAGVDLGLALFQIAESFGGKFGEAAPKKDDAAPNEALVKRSEQIDCALRVVRVIAQDRSLSAKQRAEAFFLSGNLEFLRFDYKLAVDSYDAVLALTPGTEADAGFTIGTDAAFNRAIALRRIEEEEKNKPPPDNSSEPPPQGDAGGDQKQDDQKQDDQKQDDQKQDDQKQDDQKQDDQKQDDQKQDDPKDPEPGDQQQGGQQDPQQGDPKDPQQGDSQNQPNPQQNPGGAASGQSARAAAAATGRPPSLSQDDRILESLERAPMIQHGVQGQTRGRAARGMEDK